jgi:tRNA threonylcarbamoyladenosine modification (KEOPS) complex  Pcc1 subunit
LEATITLEYESEKMAQAIASAVSPDNFKTPPGLTITTKRKDRSVVTEIYAQTKMTTFIATIDDLLSSASTAEKILKLIKKE